MQKHQRRGYSSSLILLAFGLAGAGPVLAQPPDQSFVRGRLLVKFRPEVSNERAQGVLAAGRARTVQVVPGIGVHVVELPENADERAFLNVFRGHSDIETAELDQIRTLEQTTPNDPMLSTQWQLSKVQARQAWAGSTGSSVIIGIVDTGVDSAHPDLSGHLVTGWNFYNGNSDTADVHGHGTKVAGTAAAIGNNLQGGASVAWNAWIMPLRVGGPTGSASDSAIANAIIWAADRGARVANASYMVSDSYTIASAADYMRKKGGVVTVSAGNYSTFVTQADVPSLVTVSATDPNDALYSWSNYGNVIDVAAPGCVDSTTLNGGSYGGACGTSFSAPMAAGVAALIISKNPSLTGDDVIRILRESADDLGASGWDTVYGSGRINAERAIAMAGSGASDSVPPSISITWPSSGGDVSGTIPIQVSALDNFGVTSVSYSLNGTNLGSSSTAPFTYNWDTTGWADGSYTLTAAARDAAGNQSSTSIAVTVNNVTTPPPADTTAPVVVITSPAGGNVSGNVTVTVSAIDNLGVVKTELYVNGTFVSRSTTSPFTMSWHTKKHRALTGQNSLVVKAYDATGNVGTSPPAIVNVR